MNSAIERLLSLRVSDVMQRHVIQLPAYGMMSEAAETFLKHEISGAPVVDDHGCCVGILSALDFVRRERDLAQGRAAECKQAKSGPKPMLNLGFFDDERIERNMIRNVQSVTAEATLMDAARIMCAAHVHRVPVLDASERPIGMVSSLDIVAAIVHAIEE